MQKNEELTDVDETLLETAGNRFFTHWYSLQTAYDLEIIDRSVYEVFYEDVPRRINAYPPMHRKFREIMANYSMSSDVSCSCCFTTAIISFTEYRLRFITKSPIRY